MKIDYVVVMQVHGIVTLDPLIMEEDATVLNHLVIIIIYQPSLILLDWYLVKIVESIRHNVIVVKSGAILLTNARKR